MAQSKPGWCVELTGHPMDLESWKHELRPPFDPYMENLSHETRELTLLRSSAFDQAEEAAQARQTGRALIDQLQGAMQILLGHVAEIDLGASILVGPDGRPSAHYFLEAETAVIRVRSSIATLTAYDAAGNVIPPPPPPESAPQRWIGNATKADRILDLLVYLGRADNWFDIFKAFEVARELAGDEKALSDASGVGMRQIERLRRTANSHRHAGGPHTAPPDPLPLGDARALLNTLARSQLG